MSSSSFRSGPSSIPLGALRWRGWLSLLLLCLLAGLAGCQTGPERRIRQNPELFMSLDPEAQELIRAGEVAVGFTPEMVRLAWGRPDERQVTRTAEGESHVWTYVSRHSVYTGRRFAGYDRDVYYDNRSRQYRTFMRPVYVSTYQTVENDVGRVVFRDGKAAVITRAE